MSRATNLAERNYRNVDPAAAYPDAACDRLVEARTVG